RLLVALLLLVAFGARAQLPGFERIEQTLKLNPQQREQFDMAVGATQRDMLSVGLSALQLKERLARELLKDRPDMRCLADVQEQLIEQNRPLFRAAREE